MAEGVVFVDERGRVATGSLREMVDDVGGR